MFVSDLLMVKNDWRKQENLHVQVLIKHSIDMNVT